MKVIVFLGWVVATPVLLASSGLIMLAMLGVLFVEKVLGLRYADILGEHTRGFHITKGEGTDRM